MTALTPDYKPSSTAYVVKTFIFGGKEYLAGEMFPVDTFDANLVRRQWEVGKIAFGKPPKALTDSLPARKAASVKAAGERAKAKAKERKREAKAKANGPQNSAYARVVPPAAAAADEGDDEDDADAEELERQTAPAAPAPNGKSGAHVPARP